MIEMIAFLGNYGKKYEKTRHNAAWIISEDLKFISPLCWQKKFKGQYSKLPCPASNMPPVHIIKPETYMNLSGESIAELAAFFRIKSENILVVHDELELPPAVISLKWAGGLGGHNGLRSIKAELGSADFWRLRIGIGRPDSAMPGIAGYVLSPFSQAELDKIKKLEPITNAIFDKILAGADLQILLKTYAKVKPE